MQLVKLSDLNLSYNRLERIAPSLFSSIPSPPLRFRCAVYSSVSLCRSGSACALPQHYLSALTAPTARALTIGAAYTAPSHSLTGQSVSAPCASSYAASAAVSFVLAV